MSLSSDQIADLVTLTLDKLGRAKWTDLTTDIQEFHYLPQILRKEKVTFSGGTGIKRNVMVQHSGAAKHVGLFEKDTVNVADTMQSVRETWAHTTTNWAFDEREPEMNSGAEQIVDLVKVRRADAMISLAELMEETFWSLPPANTDNTTPRSVFYWVVPWTTGDAAPSTGGFKGLDPICADGSEFTSGAGGMTSDTYGRWANWTCQFDNVTKGDLIDKMREASVKTTFRSPIEMPSYSRGTDRYGIYCDYTTRAALCRLGEQQNENLGRDLASMDGSILFHSRPVYWIPQLDTLRDATTGQIIIGINWSQFYPYFLRGEYLKESKPITAADQHRVKENFIDLTHNTITADRRRHWCISVTSNTGTTS